MKPTRQRRLFDENALLSEAAAATGRYAQVVFDRPLRTAFTYAVPPDLVERIGVGKRVLAPFGRGNTRTTGYCVGLPETPPASTLLKAIQAVLDERPLIAPTMLELTRWIADYYYCGWGQVLEAVLPGAVKHERGTRWTVLLSPAEADQRKDSTLTLKQQRAFEALVELKRPASVREIGQIARCGADCVKQLLAKGWATAVRQRVHQNAPRVVPVVWDKPRTLNDAQQTALDEILSASRERQSKTFLLHGVTGSGKTEVYLQAIANAVAAGKEAIVLVPEISLTPQTIERFRKRFDHVAVLHSHLTDVERHWHWKRIAEGEIQVVVGARSAIFAPCPNLGLVVIDEEHESSFKQEQTPRYHAREVAIQRCRLEGCPLVLGSATPSLESWQAAIEKKFHLLSLPHRVADLPMPRVSILDMRHGPGSGGYRAISKPLADAIRETVTPGGQVILLLNRRGFSTTLLCPQCGRVEKCQHCDISLTYHKEIHRLLCHSCDAEFMPPEKCADCGMPAIRFAGFGAERLEEEVRTRFPDFRCARMDSDTMRSAAHYEETLGAFRRGEIDILLGTQMIAKGLDFPNVHLVGVISADTGRNLPDFRASERTFQLIAQVAGRTGRGETPGRVLVQTFNPEDPAILAASRHDYLRFVRQELPNRQELGYPPFEPIIRVIVRSPNEANARDCARMIAERFRHALPVDHGTNAPKIRVLGPAAAPVAKLRDAYRMHFQIHVRDVSVRQKLLERVFDGLELPSDVEYAIDVDPVSML